MSCRALDGARTYSNNTQTYPDTHTRLAAVLICIGRRRRICDDVVYNVVALRRPRRRSRVDVENSNAKLEPESLQERLRVCMCMRRVVRVCDFGPCLRCRRR